MSPNSFRLRVRTPSGQWRSCRFEPVGRILRPEQLPVGYIAQLRLDGRWRTLPGRSGLHYRDGYGTRRVLR